jgi:hypothetical protein
MLSDTDREPYLQLATDAFEARRLEPYDYTQFVAAIERATSVHQLEAIADELAMRSTPHTPGVIDPAGVGTSSGTTGGPKSNPVRLSQPGGLDPVDVARMGAANARRPPGPASRYVVLILLMVMFAILIVIGAWLAGHVHSGGSSSGSPAMAAVLVFPVPA